MEEMSRLGTFVTNFVKTALYTIQPSKVEEYPYEQYAADFYLCERVQELYHSFIFYKIANYFEMIYIPPAPSLDTPSKERRVFSLFRFQGDVNEGLVLFARFAEIFQQLTRICAVYDVKVDKAWLKKVTSLSRRNPKWTLAHLAAAMDFAEAFQHRQITVHLNEADEDTGETPLHVAVKAGSAKTVQALLILPETKLDVCDHAGNTILHSAVGLSSLELLKIILEINTTQKEESAAPNASTIALYKPSGFKNSDRLDINAMNAAGETCLHLAIHNTVVPEAIVTMLLQAGANPKVGTTDSMPIHLAVEKNLIWCVDLMHCYYPDVINLQTRDKKLSTLHVAKTKPMFNHLLELGVDPNLRNSEGRTMLHQAVENQELDTVVQLLIHAADGNLADKRGICPLHLATAKCLDVHIVYALIVFEADVNATDAEGLSPRHWLCQHESGLYQKSPMRDKILYALDAVQAQRCPLGRANCTSGCISPLSVSRKSPQTAFTCGTTGDEVPDPQISLEPPRSVNFSYLTQLLQDTPFASALGRSDDDPTNAELFNGTPPDPVLSNTNLTQDLDNDLFLCLAGRGSPSVSSRSTSPRKRSSAPEVRPFRGFGSSTTSSVREKVGLKSSDGPRSPIGSESPPPEVGESPVLSGHHNQTEAEERCISPTIVQKTTDSWFRRTIIARFLSMAVPGLDSLLMTDETTAPIIEGVEALPNCPEEEEKMKNGGYESDPCPAEVVIVPPSVNISSVELASISEIQDEKQNHQQKIQHSASTDTFHTVEKQNEHDSDQQKSQLNEKSNTHNHRWRGSVDGCSGLPGVICCLDRNARRFAAQHEGINGITHTSLPTANLKNLCAPSTSSSSRCISMDNLQKDPEGFRASRRGYRVLCLDGGGIRGLVLCQVLRAIERAAGRPIRDLYDWIIGTSTGAMLALNLVQGKCVRYNRCLYFRMKENIFVGNRPYPTEGLESLLREEFGDTPVMTDILDVRVSVTALRGDHFPPRLHIFRNYPAPYEKMECLISELIEAKSPSTTSDLPATASSGNSAVPSTSSTSNSSSNLPINSTSSAPPIISAIPTSLQIPDSSLSADVSYKRLLASCLHDLFGETLREVGRSGDDESDLQETIVSLLSSFSRRYLYSFKGIEQPVPNSEVPIWRAARASGAAPSYFRACGPYLDGGLISNNPTMDLLTEAQELNIVRRLRREPTIPIASITSLGTGRAPLREVQQLDVFRPQNMSEAYRVALGVTELSRMLVEMATMSEGRIVERSRAWCSSLGIPFFRFSPLLSDNIALDTKDERAILQMLWETEAYLCNCQDRILRLVDSLLAMVSDAPPSPSQSDTSEKPKFPSNFSV